ncbi:hypothetical protein CRG98_046184 [Punica granatum]|uniref:CCHC-type domain-containing protein n=1 Tax=Punica granatum TaxID=22663 RepID=A0A2I0HP04_PUNGR|nr:hypothetical protein CRG98_046184 [Punica granatum]
MMMQAEEEGLRDNSKAQQQMPPTHSFNGNGNSMYFFSQPEGKYCYYDVCDCGDYDVCHKKKREPPYSEEATKNIDSTPPEPDVDLSLSIPKKKKKKAKEAERKKKEERNEVQETSPTEVPSASTPNPEDEEEEVKKAFMVSSKENPISSFLKKSCQADQMIVFSSMHIYEEPYDSSQEEEIEPSEAVSEDSSWKTEESEDSYPSLKMMGRGLGVEDPDENVRKYLYLHFKHMVHLFYELGANISLKCHVCNRSGHCAKNCPSTPKRGIKLVQQLENAIGISLKKDEVELLFSLDEEVGLASIAVLEVLTNFDFDFSEPESDSCYVAAEMTEDINLVNSVPHVPVSVYSSKYTKPIEVIAILDTRVAQIIMNPEVLSKEYCKPYTKHFSISSSEVFSTHLKSKPIKIQFFPGCSLIIKVLGSTLPRKDIVIGWDIITEMAKLIMMPEGVLFKQYFQLYVQTLLLFMAQQSEIEKLVNGLKEKSCADSHQEFLKKCPHPLWKSEQFYVRLPFKKNEDINPIKDNHSGMSPKHQQLASSECVDLLQ